MDTTNESGSKYFLPVAVIVAGLLIAGAVYWNGAHPSAGGPSAGGAPSVDAASVKTEGNPFIGEPNAPVTLIEFSDFQCPFCKQFETNTLPQLLTDYVNTGKVKIVFMDFAFLGNDSIDAGLYSHAIWKLYPDKYLTWREAMYKAQDAEGDQGFGDAASIDKLNATIAGIDAAKVAADVKANAGTYQAMMDADKAEAAKAGINATPSFIVGKQLIAGAYPFPTFQGAIDALLK